MLHSLFFILLAIIEIDQQSANGHFKPILALMVFLMIFVIIIWSIFKNNKYVIERILGGLMALAGMITTFYFFV